MDDHDPTSAPPDVTEGPQNRPREEIAVERVRRALLGFLHHARRKGRSPRARDYAGQRLEEARRELEQLQFRWNSGVPGTAGTAGTAGTGTGSRR